MNVNTWCIQFGNFFTDIEIVRIEFKFSLTPSHQWTPDVYERVRFVRKISTSLPIYEILEFFKTPWTCRREMLSPLRLRHNFYLFK
uniref:Uncharacterized protein n=1 Tax=Manihot esculenta TaxID=3983 RepID=A0A2C9UAD8_MANES